MSERGWIKLHRQIQECWIWEDKPFNMGAAWADMLLMANHRDKKIIFDKKPLVVKAGCFITSTRKLADKWGWSRTKLDRFLHILVDEKMITLETSNKKTAISIVNYCVYQETQATDNATDDATDQTTDNATSEPQTSPQKDTNKNIKNIKNVKNEKKERNIRVYFPNDELLNQTFGEYVAMRKQIKAPMSDKAIELAISKLEEMSNGNNDIAVQILNQSILNSWKGIFPLKQKEEKSDFMKKWENA